MKKGALRKEERTFERFYTASYRQEYGLEGHLIHGSLRRERRTKLFLLVLCRILSRLGMFSLRLCLLLGLAVAAALGALLLIPAPASGRSLAIAFFSAIAAFTGAAAVQELYALCLYFGGTAFNALLVSPFACLQGAFHIDEAAL